MTDYIYDEEIYKNFGTVDIIDSMPGDPETAYIVRCNLENGETREYGLYNYYKAKEVVNQIVDDNINYKFPFLNKPLDPKTMNIDGAVSLTAAVLESEKEAYIVSARKLRALGYHVPTSGKEYMELNLNKEIKEELERVNKTISLLKPDEDEEDKKIYDRLVKKRAELEAGLGGLYNQIRFVEDGALGTLNVLNGGFSSEEILRTWKNEAIYGKNYNKVRHPYTKRKETVNNG